MLKSADSGHVVAADEQHAERAERHRMLSDRTASPTETIGTVIATADGGTTWAQQGNPLSGPTTALNVTNVAGLSSSGRRALRPAA